MKMRRLPLRLRLWSLLLAALMVGASAMVGLAQPASPPSATPTTVSVANGSDKHIVPSPDGRYLAAAAPTQLCVTSLPGMNRVACPALAAAGIELIDEFSIAWSADGSTLAFSEAYVPTDPSHRSADIWTLDPASGALTHITGANNNGAPASTIASPNQADARVDASPVWSADGDEIIFARSSWTGEHWQTAIARVAATGGVVKTVAVIAGNEGMVIPSGLLGVTADGSIVYTESHARGDDPNNGLWSINADGGHRRLLVAADHERGMAILVDLSHTGDRALIYFSNGFQRGFTGAAYSLLDLRTGDLEPLPPAQAAPSHAVPLVAALSPDGSAVFVVWGGGSTPAVGVVSNLSTETEIVVGQDLRIEPPTYTGQGSWWATNGTIFVAEGAGSPNVLTLQTTNVESGATQAIAGTPATAATPATPAASPIAATPALAPATSSATATATATSTATPASTNTPTPEPTSTATATAAATATATAMATAPPTATATVAPSPTAPATSTPKPTSTPTALPTATATPLPTATATVALTATATPAPTATATATATATPQPSPTATATSTPRPTITPALGPVVTPTTAATPIPNVIPPASPTAESIFGPILSIPGLDHGRILPSPDGRYVATVASDLLCIHNAKMLQRKNCANLERAGLVGIDVNGVVWSPDSRHLALTEPFAPTGDKGVESDLWRYDIDSATLTDLTIDRIAGKVATLTGEGTSFISATGPAWSPDGQAILFVQSEWNGGWSTTIGRIPANGGAVATVLIVDPDEPMTVPTGSLQVTSEGNIIFTRDRAAPTDPGNGVWQVSIFGSEMTQLLAPPSDATFVPRVVALSPTEQHALVLFPREGKDGQSANAPALLDLQTGSIKLLGLNGGPSSIEGRATMAAFSPDGTALIYVWAPVNDGEQQVVVRMLINGSETVLGSGVETAPTDGHGAWWTTDGMVFLNASNANPRFYRFNPDVTVPRG